MKYKIHTEATCGFVYEVEAESEQEALERFDDCDWSKYYEDLEWEGESNEEIIKIEKI